MAFWALHSIVYMQSIAAIFTKRMSTKHKQAWNVQFLVKLFFAMSTDHLTVIILLKYNLCILKSSIKMPTCKVIIIRILFCFFYICQQFLFIILVYEFTSLLTLSGHQTSISPLFWHRPDLYRLGFRRRYQPLFVRNKVQLCYLGIKGLKNV